MLILLYNCFISFIFGSSILTSATIRDNKLYTIHQEVELGIVKCKVYELKESQVIDIVNSVKTFKLLDNLNGYELVFIHGLDGLKVAYNKLWVRAELTNEIRQFGNSSYKNWVGYINIEDMILIKDLSLIKFPTHENFPIIGYTINRVADLYGSVLYFTGGVLFSKSNDRYSIGNSFFKYNLTTREWADMSYLANGKLKPLTEHKSIVIDNRYLVSLGGYSEKSKGDIERFNTDKHNAGIEVENNYNYLYSLTVFDAVSNIWENVNIEPNLFDTSVANFEFYGFLAALYIDKIIVLGGVVNEKTSNLKYTKPYLGILDYRTKVWSWVMIDSINNKLNFNDPRGVRLLVYHSQLIISSGILLLIIINFSY
jgi:hypothetical protein